MWRTSQVFVRESSMVPIYSVLLFGGELTVLHDRGLLKVCITQKTPPSPACDAAMLEHGVKSCAAGQWPWSVICEGKTGLVSTTG